MNATSDLVIYADPAFQSSAGIERYTAELIRGIHRSDLRERVVFLTSRPEWKRAIVGLADEPTTTRPLRGLAAPPRVVTTRLPARALRYSWSLAGMPRIEHLVGGKVGMVHAPASVCLPTLRAPQLTTVHDVFSTKLPALLSLRQRLVLTRHLERAAIKRSAHVIADSESTRRDVMELFGLPAERITVVPLGIDHAAFRPVVDEGSLAAIRNVYGCGDRFVLYVGSLYSRKVGRLLEAFASAVQLARDPECQLVLVGGRPEASARALSLGEQVRALQLKNRVIITGTVPAGHIPVLMSAATAFAYVSFYEGFGLPPLEAMACGAPVVASNVSSIPEVVGDGGWLVSPHDADEIAWALGTLLTDADRRAELRKRALRQAARFSWERTIQSTLETYRRVLSE
ncbi:MAG: glycosyltransferase family 4 protein [Gemmatimonadaceae bacterium]